MRQGPHQKRGRGRGNRRPNTPNRNQTFDSNGPDVRIRGNAHQVYEKYLNLARDATAAGDRVLAESYYQYADHYYRIVSAFTENDPERRDRPNGPGNQPSGGPRDWSDDDEDGEDDRPQARSNDRGQNDRGQSDRGFNDRGSSDRGGDREERRPEPRQGQDRQGQDRQVQDRRDHETHPPAAAPSPAPAPAPVRVDAPPPAAAPQAPEATEVGAEPPRRPRGRPRRTPTPDAPVPTAEEDGIRRTLRMSREPSAETQTSAPATAEPVAVSPSESAEEAPRARRRRRPAGSEESDQPAVKEDDSAAAAS